MRNEENEKNKKGKKTFVGEFPKLGQLEFSSSLQGVSTPTPHN